MFLNVAVSTQSTNANKILLLTTGGTAVWLFSSVASLVLQKFSVRVERFSALVTGERLVCGMSPFVLLQITQVVKSWVINMHRD